MIRSLRPWVIFCFFSIVFYGASVFVSNKNFLLSGRYTTTVQNYTIKDGVWKGRIEVDLDDKTLESTISLEGDGLEGVALFALSGKINRAFKGDIEISYVTEAIQTTKVLDGYQAGYYSSMFLSGKWQSHLIYHDENVDVITRGQRYLMLSRD
tara:strand:+ start:801 stop:1259 length:459 start_codon:yes stop_codon:yes gene_type:complete